ncbi:di-heme oxidoredictase family protein [soil metagenome]
MQSRLLVSVTLLAACGDNTSLYEKGEELAGGETTVFETGNQAFSLSARNLTSDRRAGFFDGNAFFKRNWVTAPASTSGQDGLGPTFNAPACASCHLFDGRGSPPAEATDEDFLGLLVRLSIPGADAHGGPLDEPNYGGQFNHHSILQVPAEGRSHVAYTEAPGAFADGTPYSLRIPTYTFTELAFGAMDPNVMTSPRVANVMIGLGLLEAISEDEVLVSADENDEDGDGISGRPNMVWDVTSQSATLGRFGWKANQPSIVQQVQGAFNGDIGITSALFPNQNCPAAQTACANAINGDDPDDGNVEADAQVISTVIYYSRLLAVPARRDVESTDVLYGKQLFHEAGCASCHPPKHVTGDLEGLPEVSQQTIFPYTDLLLHDMGDADADHRPDFLATGNEWRTPPLWGLGLVPVVNGHSTMMHDGRARNVAEAILWHGGEASKARDAFNKMSVRERDQLVKFVESL